MDLYMRLAEDLPLIGPVSGSSTTSPGEPRPPHTVFTEAVESTDEERSAILLGVFAS